MSVSYREGKSSNCKSRDSVSYIPAWILLTYCHLKQRAHAVLSKA